MSKGKVLISGANGYIGAVTVGAFLDAGWSVRGTVRRLESAEPLKEVLKKYVDDGKLEIVAVPDITVDGAFDEAVKGVHAIAHIASPVSMSFTDPDPVIHAAVNGTKTILKSAKAFAGPQLKAFVMTSSVAAIMNDNVTIPHTFDETQWNTTAVDVVKEKGKETPGPTIYRASKTLSETALWDFVKEEKPTFTATAINPS
jgi:nucleoside-diphosphate-sugar epimerase